MAFALDTNIFVYAQFERYPENQKARSFLEGLMSRQDPFYIGYQVLYEYVRLVTHPGVHRVPLTASAALEDMKPYLNDSRCRILIETENHHQIFEEVIRKVPSARGNFIHDCHYAALLREHGVEEIVTTDSDFKKFDFLKVINPVLD